MPVRRLLSAGLVAAVTLPAQSTFWRQGNGEWTDYSHWSAGIPTGFLSAVVGGNASVHVPAGIHIAGDLNIGIRRGDHSRVELDGGALILMQDSLHVGEDTGGEGEFVLRSGAMHCVMDVFIGGASEVPGAANKATLRIQGGTFLGRTLTIGIGTGAEALVSIEGSRATAVHTLDYVSIGDNSTLAFTLDEHGVTPITIQSPLRSLIIAPHARLKIALAAAPPPEHIRLVSGRVKISGAFDNLPEGSEIAAEFAGRTYRWRLTYRGGSGNDLVLLAERTAAASSAARTAASALARSPALSCDTSHRYACLPRR